jgi:hypothetical protein
MGSRLSAPGPQEKRFAAYIEGLAKAAGHADRKVPLKNYCTGLLLPGERKSVEPMAARLAPDNVQRMHQSLHHLVADAPWSDPAIIEQVRSYVLSAIKSKGPVQAWIVDDTGFPKKGTHSVGVARQYCGQVGKQDNCRVAVSLSVSTNTASLPIAWRLYLPEAWAHDAERRRQAGVPEQIRFQTKPEIALEQIRQAVADEVTRVPVLADAGYGIDSKFRAGITALGLPYVVGVQSSTSIWAPGKAPLPAKPWCGQGRPPLVAQEQTPSAAFRPGVGVVASFHCVEDDYLESRHPATAAVSFCCLACPASPSGSRESRTVPGRVVIDGVAQGGKRTHQVLVVHTAGLDIRTGIGEDSQASLDHRTRLRGTQTGTRPRALRR